MKKINFILGFLLAIIPFFIIFKNLFSSGQIVGGDWPYFFEEQINDRSPFPSTWKSHYDLGGPIASPWIDWYTYVLSDGLVNWVGVPWSIVQKIFFFFLSILLSFISPFILYRTITGKSSILPSFIYIFNTYFLLIYGGGQMGVLLAYSIAPLVLSSFITLVKRIIEKQTYVKNIAICSLILAVQVLFDPRISYISLLAVVFLILLFAFFEQLFRKPLLISRLLFISAIPTASVIFLHAFWLLPIAFFRINPIEGFAIFTNSSNLSFFSFGFFENSLSLLHPNWPENIFGKVYFMRWEFLLLPIVGFSALLFNINSFHSDKEKNKSHFFVLYFLLILLFGAFLGKGVNDPFGQVYYWLFNYIPGFVLFRDPTKFYVLIAISYAILIPIVLEKIVDFLYQAKQISKKINYHILYSLVTFVFVGIFCWQIRDAFLGQLSGTFVKSDIPYYYVLLKDFVVNQNDFSRVLWVPRIQRFGYYSQVHPAVSLENINTLLNKKNVNWSDQMFADFLKEASVKYVIVPYDSQGEIFLDDRKYSQKVFEKVLKNVASSNFLTEVEGFGKIKVFKLAEYKNHFWIESTSGSVSNMLIQQSSPTKYSLTIPKVSIGNVLIFTDRYNPYWKMYYQDEIIESQKYLGMFNSFPLPEGEEINVTIEYEPQRYVLLGSIISIVSFIILVSILLDSKQMISKIKQI